MPRRSKTACWRPVGRLLWIARTRDLWRFVPSCSRFENQAVNREVDPQGSTRNSKNSGDLQEESRGAISRCGLGPRSLSGGSVVTALGLAEQVT
jgi:hypothetical protein